MAETDPTIPQCVIDAGVVKAFVDLQPPANEEEVEDLAWYNETYGPEGVRLALAQLMVHRTHVPDPDRGLINSAFGGGFIFYTKEELDEIGTYTDEMRAEDEARQEAFSWRMDNTWPAEGITNPDQGFRKVEAVRQEQGDEAADALWVRLFGFRRDKEEVEQRTEQRLRVFRADRQRAWEALSREERRERQARLLWTLYEISQGKFDEEDPDY
jgi:hypothetical protein